jgi:hypothetical protein
MARNGKRNGKTNGQTATLKRASRIAPTADRPPRTADSRLPVLKTYKIYIGGKFPRTESGRYYILKSADGQSIANICDCTRKDFRDSVVAARAAQSSWAKRSAYNRGQILYRIAEMLEGRAAQFVDELQQQTGVTTSVGCKPPSTASSTTPAGPTSTSRFSAA